MLSLVILGIVDIVAAIMLATPLLQDVSLYLGLFILLKGFASLFGSLSSRYWYDWMGAADVLVGALLVMGIRIPFLWILPLLKGIYATFIGWMTA